MKASSLAVPFVMSLMMSPLALAIQHDGSDGEPSSFVVTVYDPATQKTFYKDLGLDYVSFLQLPKATIDLAAVTEYQAFLGKDNLVFNVFAFAPLKSDSSNKDTWGILSTSLSDGAILKSDWIGIDAIRQTMFIYASYLEADSGILPAGKPGAFGSAQWNATLWNKVGGDTTGAPGQALPFYYVTNSSGDPAGGIKRKAGNWTLATNGTLTLGEGQSILANQPPTAVANGGPKALTHGQATLDGGQSEDPDEAPQALMYTWRQTDGESVNLSSVNGARTTFSPTAPGNYQFSLTVDDGKDKAEASVSINAVSLLMKAPAKVRKGARQTVAWEYDTSVISPKKTVKLQFSKDGGKFKSISTKKIKRGSVIWKPTKKQISNNGSLRLCVGSVCDTAAVSVLP